MALALTVALDWEVSLFNFERSFSETNIDISDTAICVQLTQLASSYPTFSISCLNTLLMPLYATCND